MKTIHIEFFNNQIDIVGDYSPTMLIHEGHLYYIREAVKIAIAHGFEQEMVNVFYYDDDTLLHKGSFRYIKIQPEMIDEWLNRFPLLSAENPGIAEWLGV